MRLQVLSKVPLSGYLVASMCRGIDSRQMRNSQPLCRGMKCFFLPM